MGKVTPVGIELAKRVFAWHGRTGQDEWCYAARYAGSGGTKYRSVLLIFV